MIKLLTELERLQEFACELGIDVVDVRRFSAKKGACMKNGETSVVFINKLQIENSTEELCVLAEEVGHIEENSVLPCGDWLHPSIQYWNKRKNEITAQRWAINELLPFCVLKAAMLKGYRERWELAEYLDRPEWFIVKAIEYYSRLGLLPILE